MHHMDEPGGMMLSEISQTQKTRTAGSDLQKAFKTVKHMEAKDGVVVAGDLGEGEKGFAKDGETTSATQDE